MWCWFVLGLWMVYLVKRYCRSQGVPFLYLCSTSYFLVGIRFYRRNHRMMFFDFWRISSHSLKEYLLPLTVLSLILGTCSLKNLRWSKTKCRRVGLKQGWKRSLFKYVPLTGPDLRTALEEGRTTLPDPYSNTELIPLQRRPRLFFRTREKLEFDMSPLESNQSSVEWNTSSDSLTSPYSVRTLRPRQGFTDVDGSQSVVSSRHYGR